MSTSSAWCTQATCWPTERALFFLAGTMTLVSLVLGILVSPWFFALTAFVALNQWLYGIVRACPASKIIERVTGIKTCPNTTDHGASA